MHADDPPSTLRIGELALTVRDLDAVARFYRDVVGLRVLERDHGVVRLGAGTVVLLELRGDPEARPDPPRGAGLYHVAFLLPRRADLARWVRHVAANRIAIEGVADHGVSEAIYLRDPEGNGVEIASDRPRGAWPWIGDSLAMTTDPLDVQALLREAGPAAWVGAPDGTTIGHVHLRVGGIAPAENFYAGVLGVPLTARYPGGSFFGADRYHHHLAANVWDSRHAGPRPGTSAGLAGIVIRLFDAAAAEEVARRAAAADVAIVRRGSALVLRDPWNTPITLTAPEN